MSEDGKKLRKYVLKAFMEADNLDDRVVKSVINQLMQEHATQLLGVHKALHKALKKANLLQKKNRPLLRDVRRATKDEEERMDVAMQVVEDVDEASQTKLEDNLMEMESTENVDEAGGDWLERMK